MIEPKWTPRPWHVCGKYGDEVKSNDGMGVHCDQDFRIPDDVAKANARLIAAAPELYEALSWCMDQLSHMGIEYMPGDVALAKARGETA